MKTLSIIIPYYNSKKYTDELLDRLDQQMTADVEVILVDDGSLEPYKTNYEWCTVIRQKNKRCAGARNTGLKNATGEYIQFLDSDDMVPTYFIRRLMKEIRENPFDVCDYSWKSLDTKGVQHDKRIKNRTGRLTNPSVCTRCFSMAYIGQNRFNEKKDSTEDEDFSRKLGYLDPRRPHNHTAISDYMYLYRTSVENSKIKRFKQGLMKTKRILYYFAHVTADMSDLLDEIKEEDKTNEVWLLTYHNEIPELSRYCQISTPMPIWCHELRGEPFREAKIISQPIQTQVVIYCEFCAMVGGITTFIYNFCWHLKDYYDITVVFEKMDVLQITKLSEIVQTVRYKEDMSIICDTLILNRLTDKIKGNISFKHSIQICHACKQIKYRIPKDRDVLVNVSQAAKESWKEESEAGIVIHNMSLIRSERCLMLVSATRVNTTDKGQNDHRMRKLAEMLEAAGIKYIWLNFADGSLRDMPASFVNMKPVANIQPYVERADYLVQLSDVEAYSMSILEALELGTSVLATPFPSLFEEGFVDGKHGYVIPHNMRFDVNKLLNVPTFEFHQDNAKIIKQWRKLLGNTKPKHIYDPGETVTIKCIKRYRDTILNELIAPGRILKVTQQRADTIVGSGYAVRV